MVWFTQHRNTVGKVVNTIWYGDSPDTLKANGKRSFILCVEVKPDHRELSLDELTSIYGVKNYEA